MRLIKVSQDPRDLSWEQALDQLEDDDVLMLAPGFYEIPFGQKLKNIVKEWLKQFLRPVMNSWKNTLLAKY